MKMYEWISFPQDMDGEEVVSMMKRLASDHDLQVRQLGPLVIVEKAGEMFIGRRKMWGGWQSGLLFGGKGPKLLLTSSPVMPGPTVQGVLFFVLLAAVLLLACAISGMPGDVAVIAGVIACVGSWIANGVAVSTYEGGLTWANMMRFADALKAECARRRQHEEKK